MPAMDAQFAPVQLKPFYIALMPGVPLVFLISFLFFVRFFGDKCLWYVLEHVQAKNIADAQPSGGGIGKCFQPGEYFSLQESVDEATSRYYWWPGDNMPTPVMAKITFTPEGRRFLRFLTENTFRSAGSFEIQHFCTLSNSRVRILRGSDCEIHECGSTDPGWERDP